MNDWKNDREDPQIPEEEPKQEQEEPKQAEPAQEEPAQEEPKQEEPVYVWDGSQQGKKSGKGSGLKFLAVALACMLIAGGLIVATLLRTEDSGSLFDRNESGFPTVSGALSASAGESDYEISQTVSVSGEVYVETNDLIEVYDKCAPSCVTIYVTYEKQSSGYAIGSGFVLTEDGFIATNQHVVEDGKAFRVLFYDGREYDATLIGEDAMRDLAVLKIEEKGLTPLLAGDSSTLKVGQKVVAIGTPYDLTLAGTMTQGSISGLDREIPIENDRGTVVKTMRLIQTDASINPGNSGGPLINLAGQVVGINSMKLINEYEGIGFAIPINYAVEIFDQLIQFGKVVQDPDNDFVTASPRLGVSIYDLEKGLSQYRIRPTCEYPENGVLVAAVEPNTAVYEAGLQLYNIIVDFDGDPITSVQDLTDALNKHKAGETVTMRIFAFSNRFSKGEYRDLTFVLDSAS